MMHSCTCIQATWHLKMRALTEQVYVDEVEVDEEGIAEMIMDDNVIASVSRKNLIPSLILFLYF